MDQAQPVSPAPKPKKLKSGTPLIIVLASLIVVGAFLYWYLVLREAGVAPSPTEPPAAATIENADLGSQIFEGAQNPISGELPETVAPVPNPLEGVYQNPFE